MSKYIYQASDEEFHRGVGTHMQCTLQVHMKGTQAYTKRDVDVAYACTYCCSNLYDTVEDNSRQSSLRRFARIPVGIWLSFLRAHVKHDVHHRCRTETRRYFFLHLDP
jgi:hypothetical protein